MCSQGSGQPVGFGWLVRLGQRLGLARELPDIVEVNHPRSKTGRRYVLLPRQRRSFNH
jgi:hypothetical protein